MSHSPRFRVVIINPPQYRHSQAFFEIAESLVYAIRANGYAAEADYNRFAPGAIHIVLGSNLIKAEQIEHIPADAVLYNLEQISEDSPWMRSALPQLFQRHQVWDYSARNIQTLQAMGLGRELHQVPIGHVHELTRIPTAQEDIDVLFYGSLNERRQKILDALRARGLNVHHAFGIYGRERDSLIARSKLILNVHLYPAKILEVVRISYALANRRTVIAEGDADTEVYDGLENAVCLVPYDKLVDSCVQLVDDPARRFELATAGYAWMAARPLAPLLAPHLRQLVANHASPNLVAPPDKLKLGGISRPLPGVITVDIDNPAADIAWNPLEPLPVKRWWPTARFGVLRLEEERYSDIDLGDLPLRIVDWPGYLLGCCRLLRPGGTIRFTVPHELSGQAWADPRTQRAFAQDSFRQFGDAHISLGWQDVCLDVQDVSAILSENGKRQLEQGEAAATVLNTPRAVERMNVILVKRALRALPI